MYVATAAAVALGATLGWVSLLWVAAVLQGVAHGGGALGWSLGHDDFAPEARAVEYLGLHVTLTGIRGLFAPLIGVGLYGALEHWRPGSGAWSLVLAFLLTVVGTLGFLSLHRSQRLA